ncbi:MAG TPA: hypothetical protein VG276_24700 [Actinomycetes bacterium]|nr:hypothetical protein [Actinomycetes bacterium]
MSDLVDQAASEETGPVRRQLGSLFEQDQPELASATASPAACGEPQPATPFKGPRRALWAWLLLAPAVTLAVGLVLGFALGSARAGSEQVSAPATRSSATQPSPTPSTSVVVWSSVSSACLETATRGDEVIELLVTNRRSRIPDLLVAYSVASRQCRKDAYP